MIAIFYTKGEWPGKGHLHTTADTYGEVQLFSSLVWKWLRKINEAGMTGDERLHGLGTPEANFESHRIESDALCGDLRFWHADKRTSTSPWNMRRRKRNDIGRIKERWAVIALSISLVFRNQRMAKSDSNETDSRVLNLAKNAPGNGRVPVPDADSRSIERGNAGR